MIIKLLTKLRLKVTTPNLSREDLELQIACYVEELQKWPADIVKHVLETQAQQSKFWPAWQELHERLEWRARDRLRKRRYLSQLLEGADNENSSLWR